LLQSLRLMWSTWPNYPSMRHQTNKHCQYNICKCEVWRVLIFFIVSFSNMNLLMWVRKIGCDQ
jgi:hypothetical protein